MADFDAKVANCKTWKQLFHAALAADQANERNAKGIYYSGYRFCSADRLNTILHDVRDGSVSVNRVTRNHGLRAKAEELLQAA